MHGALAPDWVDFVLHILGGAWLAGIASIFLYSKHVRFGGGFWGLIILILGVVMLFGVLWEFYEYLACVYASCHSDLLNDTLSDLFAELIGGTALIIGDWIWGKRE